MSAKQLQEDILNFWFSDEVKPKWFVKDSDFDNEIKEKFLSLYEQAVAGKLDSWSETANGALALVILLDQFSRNLHRGSPKSYAADAKAAGLIKQALEAGVDQQLPTTEHRLFMYLPLMHSEDLADQKLCVKLFNEAGFDENGKEYARQHMVIIERFGRFPHRNEVLGRESTPEEIEFLKEPGSSF